MLNPTILELISEKSMKSVLALTSITCVFRVEKKINERIVKIQENLKDKDLLKVGTVEYYSDQMAELVCLEQQAFKISVIVNKIGIKEIKDVSKLSDEELIKKASEVHNYMSGLLPNVGALGKLSDNEKNNLITMSQLVNLYNEEVHVEHINISFEMKHPVVE